MYINCICCENLATLFYGVSYTVLYTYECFPYFVKLYIQTWTKNGRASSARAIFGPLLTKGVDLHGFAVHIVCGRGG